ncbi:homeobox protein Mohawk-like [Anthonomus grandis grandis]|uniref:homeobox protein Mohawk-like n=1 Tax=Anthonomus grandis grandis TaxID=2921223 RepID=UPI0021664D89|nr:homeobox protein Mohawk-like [Anthonomus grandis grandis]
MEAARHQAECTKEKIKRPVRNKRYNRKAFGEEKRPPKRLFTPEIKRFLKDWLVRRRDNPYPNRDEKKTLAVQTGLTYIQVCNWFANWRRKLKNAGKEPQRKTWGDLIKTYNTQVQGNVEHFSICSDDSIWEEPDIIYDDAELQKFEERFAKNQSDHSYGQFYHVNNNNNNNNNIDNSDLQNQCYFVSSTTEVTEQPENPFSQSANKYKNHIMEKYMRDCQNEPDKSTMIAKWLQSAERFRPNEGNYIDWSFNKPQKKKQQLHKGDDGVYLGQHGKEELDAAEALTSLANASRHLN